MKFKGTGKAEVNGVAFGTNVTTLLLNTVDTSIIDGFGSKGSNGYLTKESYPYSVVVENTRVARSHFVS